MYSDIDTFTENWSIKFQAECFTIYHKSWEIQNLCSQTITSCVFMVNVQNNHFSNDKNLLIQASFN